MKDDFKNDLILSGDVVLDTGLLIDFFTDQPLAEFVTNDILRNDQIKHIYIHDYIITEVFYIVCRQKGELKAEEVINELLEFSSTIPTNKLRLIAGKIKCERNISLSDCFSCSIGKKLGIPVLFKKESEIKKEIQRKEFDFPLHLLE